MNKFRNLYIGEKFKLNVVKIVRIKYDGTKKMIKYDELKVLWNIYNNFPFLIVNPYRVFCVDHFAKNFKSYEY